MEKILHDAKRHPREDLVTSSLFGALRLLTPSARRDALGVLSGHKFESDVQIYLWPYFVGVGENSEPDVVLQGILHGQPYYWIVELKWGSGLGRDQGGREIRTVESGNCRRGGVPNFPDIRKVAGYTLLGEEPKHVAEISQLTSDQEPRRKVVSFTWKEMTERLNKLAQEVESEPGLMAWAKLAAEFLAGEPQGSVLGDWPILTATKECNFDFDDTETFELPFCSFVPTCNFKFREIR